MDLCFPDMLSKFGIWLCRLCVLVSSWFSWLPGLWADLDSCPGCGLKLAMARCLLLCLVAPSVGFGFGYYVSG